jgi:hypothetical protein
VVFVPGLVGQFHVSGDDQCEFLSFFLIFHGHGLVDEHLYQVAYKTWNKEHYVSDEVIKADLSAISEGKLQLGENTQIDNLNPSSGGKTRQSTARGKNGSGRKNYGKGRRRKN